MESKKEKDDFMKIKKHANWKFFRKVDLKIQICKLRVVSPYSENILSSHNLESKSYLDYN